MTLKERIDKLSKVLALQEPTGASPQSEVWPQNQRKTYVDFAVDQRHFLSDKGVIVGCTREAPWRTSTDFIHPNLGPGKIETFPSDVTPGPGNDNVGKPSDKDVKPGGTTVNGTTINHQVWPAKARHQLSYASRGIIGSGSTWDDTWAVAHQT